MTNYIKSLEQDRFLLTDTIERAQRLVWELEAYLLSDKFHGPDNDYVNVRTDMLPKLAAIKAELVL